MDEQSTIHIDISQVPEYIMREFYEMMDKQLALFYADPENQRKCEEQLTRRKEEFDVEELWQSAQAVQTH
jgi:hypothetical protein